MNHDTHSATTLETQAARQAYLSNHIKREIHAAEYARLHKIGNRAGAKKVWAKLKARTMAVLAAELGRHGQTPSS